MDPGPDKPPIGVDVDLGNAEFGGREIFVFVHSARRGIEFAAGGIDPFHFLDRHA